MTPSQLSAIRARLDAVSDEEWFYDCVEEDQKYIVLASREEEELAYDAEGREGTRRVYGAVLIADCSTDPQLSAAERTHNAALIANAPTDLRALLDEVERLKNDLAMARQVSGELCGACGWAMKFPGEPCRCELLDEVERLTTLLAGTEAVLENEREYQTRLKAEVGQLATESFARGAEAMRESAAQQCEVSPIHGEKTTTARRYADAVRALPVPEAK